ncbi:hypothetical protein BDV96DRAFT_62687 [Lophiotrema nucula]|uniref:F-box domain-containing protein n=1 Tax=Lophiotrema nucula TaxID=690887 RepID=A0A6A5Z7Y9_9PLEO|nr:hypothetical protein BDV96DRAFT_62687 [Lophiotrema nucula]
MRLKGGRKKRSLNLQTLETDILHQLVETIFYQNYHDLLNLSQVSHRLYVFATPWIYRRVTVNFTRPGDLELLDRLLRAGSKLPVKIRRLEFIGVRKATEEQHEAILKLLQQLTNLEKLVWDGYIDIPPKIMSEVSRRFPGARIVVVATQLSHSDTPKLYLGRSRVLFTHRAAGQLTSFTFKPSSSSQMYRAFKVDLLNLLANSQKLKRIDIYDLYSEPGTGISFLENLQHFRKNTLPKPKFLQIWCGIKIFTPDELTLWGEQGGWERLEDLTLSYTDELLGFVGQVPELQYLHISPEFSSPALDLDSLEEQLVMFQKNDRPLGKLRSLSYKPFGSIGNSNLRRWVVPWCIIDHATDTLEDLDMAHLNITEGHIPGMQGPLADDIRKLRVSCSKLEKLSMDLLVENHWPYALMTELALFKSPLKLNLALHQTEEHHPRQLTGSDACWKAFRHMVAVRKLFNIEPDTRYRVGFKRILPWEEMKHHAHESDYVFYQTKSGGMRCNYIKFFRRYRSTRTWPAAPDVSHIPTVELWREKSKLRGKHLKYMATFHRAKTWNAEDVVRRNAVTKELRRRTKYGLAAKTWSKDVTLYDEWD